MKAQKNIELAGLFFLGFDTYNVGSKVSPLELQVSPAASISVRAIPHGLCLVISIH